MAEGLVRWVGKGRVESFSAGSEPRPVHPLAVRVMADIEVDTSSQRSKPLDDFLEQQFDFVITVCDRAKESCPRLPTAREHIHWRIDDPADATGSEADVIRAFARAR